MTPRTDAEGSDPDARIVGALLAIALAVAFAGDAGAQDQLFRAERPAMGTTFAVSLYAADPAAAEATFEVAFEEIERVEQLLSDYRPTSELSRVNRLAGQGPVTVEPELHALLVRVRGISEATGGAFDPTVGALVDAWGFRAGAPSVPEPHALATAMAATGMRHATLDTAARTVRFDDARVRLDPGAFGKGYAADRAVRALAASGVTRALVNAGASTFRALAPPPGEPGWTVTVAKGDAADTLRLVHAGLSVSGQGQRRFTSGDTTYGHVLDPLVGRPAAAGRLAAVQAPDALEADALSTASYVLGPKRAGLAARGRQDLSILVLPAASDPSSAYRWRWPPGQAPAFLP
jgi:thiamine biosynthesis lipoprotein